MKDVPVSGLSRIPTSWAMEPTPVGRHERPGRSLRMGTTSSGTLWRAQPAAGLTCVSVEEFGDMR